ncbi:hypothetical protein LZ32DRAFT_354693 [Colletotrichum eremochloae]|nr:hypothetical protein LZ32DRAFT_354693 [Colletotrichum eremochloae]
MRRHPPLSVKSAFFCSLSVGKDIDRVRGGRKHYRSLQIGHPSINASLLLFQIQFSSLHYTARLQLPALFFASSSSPAAQPGPLSLTLSLCKFAPLWFVFSSKLVFTVQTSSSRCLVSTRHAQSCPRPRLDHQLPEVLVECAPFRRAYLT